MIDHTKTSPEKLAEMNDSLLADNTHLRARLLSFKRAAYKRGLYTFPVPPVTTAGWSDQDWINYIDLHGAWME